jgi:hypothetical protein
MTLIAALVGSYLNPRTTGAIAVLSPCGIYAVLEVQSNGQVRKYDGAEQMSEEDRARVMALPEEARIGIVVPCPNFSEAPVQ